MLDQLPGDVLAMVMSHLSVDDLFACRLVCKRLAALAQHPDVWRHRHLDWHGGRRRRCPVLRLAPCMRKIYANVPPPFGRQCRHCDLRTTSCAGRELSMVVLMDKCGPAGAEAAVQTIKQQKALGRLRAVRLSFCEVRTGSILTAGIVDLLLGTLASTAGLEEVELEFKVSRGVQVAPASAGRLVTVAPSLKSFSCRILPWTVAFCNFMLASHAATLEAVGFINDDRSPVDAAALSPFRVLAGMPNLRELSSRVMPGLGQAAACKSLRSLNLDVEPVSGDNAPGALELLANAHQLRSLHLNFRHDGDDAEEDALLFDSKLAGDLIGALASSGQSQVEVLAIEVQLGAYLPLETADRLRLALPSLPALRRLEVNLAPHTLLGGISSLTAPSLRGLQIALYESESRICFHVLLHSGELAALMSRNPLIHLELQHASCRLHEDDELFGSDLCERSCHEDVKKLESVGIFAHSKGECPSPEDHAIERCNWFHIDDVRL